MIVSGIILIVSVYVASKLVPYVKKITKQKNKLKDNDYMIEFN